MSARSKSSTVAAPPRRGRDRTSQLVSKSDAPKKNCVNVDNVPRECIIKTDDGRKFIRINGERIFLQKSRSASNRVSRSQSRERQSSPQPKTKQLAVPSGRYTGGPLNNCVNIDNVPKECIIKTDDGRRFIRINQERVFLVKRKRS